MCDFKISSSRRRRIKINQKTPEEIFRYYHQPMRTIIEQLRFNSRPGILWHKMTWEKSRKISVNIAKKYFFCRKKATQSDVVRKCSTFDGLGQKVFFVVAKSDLNSSSSLWYLKKHGENVFVITAHLLHSFGFLDR